MKIALVTETFPPEVNGVAMTLRRLVEGLVAGGDQLCVVRPRQQSDRGRPAQDGAESMAPGYDEWLMPGVALPRYEGLMMGLPVEGKLRRSWGQERPDVVHIATEGPLGWSALRAARTIGVPVTSSFHTNFHQYGRHYGYGALQEVAVSYLRYFHNLTRLTMVPTRQMRAELTAQGFQNVTVVSRGVDARLFTPERRSEELRRSWGAAPEDPVFIHVGRLAREKNIELAVESFLAAREVAPRARFVLVGDGPERAALQARYPDFQFAGMRSGEDLATHYASADVFLFPSITETFGNVVTEALASGLVVVAYDYAAGREHVLDQHNGVLVPFDQPAAFRAATIATIARAADWPTWRAHAREAALQVTWDAIVARFRDHLAAAARASDIVGPLI